jgi:predicted transcriptional regulator
MTDRYLTITLQSDWKEALRAAAQVAKADTYQGEVLNFETPAQFFGQLTQKRWDLVRAAQGKGDLSVRELARLVDRDVKRVHEDVVTLADLGLLERTERGGVICPYTSMHIDMYLKAAYAATGNMTVTLQSIRTALDNWAAPTGTAPLEV